MSQWMFDFNAPKPWKLHFAQADPPDEKERDVFDVREHKLEWLKGQIEKLNKVAKKLGLEPVRIEILEEYTLKDPSDPSGMVTIPMSKIKVIGNSPQITTPSGETWKFISRIMHSEEGNILKSVPGEELPLEYRTISSQCQHCGYKRRRNDTFVLQNPDNGKYIQVGSSCLKDFLGHKSANAYAQWAEMLADMTIELGYDDEEGGGGGSGLTHYGIESFLKLIYAVTKAAGKFMSKTKARETEDTATVDQALNLFHSKDEKNVQFLRDILSRITPEDSEMLASALEWARSLRDLTEEELQQSGLKLDDYLWNLAVACSRPVVSPQTTGIVASLPMTFEWKVLGKLLPEPQLVAGQKGDVVVSRAILEEENLYSDMTVYRAKIENNKTVQWSSSPISNAIGDTINIEGVVVGYTKRIGTVITRLARVKILGDEEFVQRQQEVGGQAENLAPAAEYNVGEKVTVDVTILSHREIEGHYGTTTLYKMIDPHGNVLSWFSSGQTDFEEGEKLNITATVKKIGEYNGQPDIQITRAKINSRALTEGTEDKRMAKKELSAFKREMKKVEKEIAKLDEAGGGISDGPTFNDALRTIEAPISFFTSQVREQLNQLRRDESYDYGVEFLVVNWQRIDEVINQLIQMKQQIIEPMRQELAAIGEIPPAPQLEDFMQDVGPMGSGEARNKFYAVEKEWRDQYGDANWKRQGHTRQVDAWTKTLEQMQTQRSQLLPEFQQKAQQLASQIETYKMNKPHRDELAKQLDDMGQQLYEHQQLTKQYGKKPEPPKSLLASNWLQILAG